MSTASPSIRPSLMMIGWLALFIAIPALVVHLDTQRRAAGNRPMAAVAQARRPTTPPPTVEPLEVYALPPETAKTLNDAIPFSALPNPAARPFVFTGNEFDLARATDCLAAAQLFEAGDDAVGEQAVAQVVLNRVRHPAFPKTVCGVVFQGQERTTGCQFTFSCDGALARTPGPAAWDRARAIAKGALAGKVFRAVGFSTHYHTDWVVPYWSSSLDKVTAVGTHLFFRWRGWWGTPPAFRRGGADNGEPLIARIARFSTAHRDAPGADGMASEVVPANLPGSSVGSTASELASRPLQPTDPASLAKLVPGARLIAATQGAKTFLVELAPTMLPHSWPSLAQTLCAGRPECRIMGWRAGTAPPVAKLTDDQMDAMAFAYIHNVRSGLQRVLWNCAQIPRANPAECMRQRVPAIRPPGQASAPAPAVPAPLAGVRRPDRFETVRIAPPAPPATP